MLRTQRNHINGWRKVVLLVLACLTLQVLPGPAQVLQPFLPRVAPNGPSTSIYNINGDFTIIGNTNLTLEDYSLNFQNNYPMVYIDEDNDPQTFNSSASTLVFSNENGADPSCSRVLFAGLYWTGRSSEEMEFQVTKSGITQTLDKREVKIKAPGQADYTRIRAQNDQIWFPESYQEQDGLYVGYADVTDLVQAAGAGEYWLADVALLEGTGGSIGFYGGWGMVVVYENAAMQARDVVVFDGFAYVESYLNQNNILDLQGFSAVASGPVSVKLGVMAAEGERGGTGDFFEIERGVNSGEFIRLEHELNDTFNFFNSSIYTGGNPRNPELINNTGMDLAVFELPNEGNGIIGNGQTRTRFNYASVIDTYAIFNITFSISARRTQLEAIQQFSGNNPQLEEVYQVESSEPLDFRVEIRNKGQESVTEGKLEIPIPQNVVFDEVGATWLAPSGNPAEPVYDASLGPGGTLVWEMGEVAVPEDPDALLGYLEYRLLAPDNCSGPAGFQCAASFNLSGEVTGKNATTEVPFANPVIQGYGSDQTCVFTPLTEPLRFEARGEFGSCEDSEDPLAIQLCNVSGDEIPVSEVVGYFPAATRFYDSYPVEAGSVEYSAENPFPKLEEAQPYVAVLDGEGDCFRPFTLSHQTMEALPTVTSSYNGAQLSCFGAADGAVVALVEGGVPPYTYQWDDPGNSTTRSVENLPAGTYTVIVTDSQDCRATGSVTLENPAALEITLDEQLSNLNPGCDPGDAASVAFEVSGGSLPVSAELLRLNDDGTEETVQTLDFGMNRNRSFDGLLSGDYLIRVSDTNACQQETAFQVTGAEPLVYTHVITPVQRCEDLESASIEILPEGDPDALSYEWSTGATTARLSDIGPGSYSVIISNESGCSQEEVFVIEAPEPPVFTIASSTEVLCGEPGLKTTFLVISEQNETGLTITWSGGEITDNGFTMSSSQPGTYTVTLTDEKGCASTEEVAVLPYALDASFTYSGPGVSTDVFIGETVSFEPQFNGNVVSFRWDFGDGNQATEMSPTHAYRQQGTYLVRLELLDGNGCTAEYTREVTILAFEVRMPDAFTPDAADGSNSHYFPVFTKVDGLEFWVFNKWGEVIFYTNDAQSAGWNGDYQGDAAPAGSYVYRVNYTAPNGGTETQSGSFLLLR